MKKYWALVAVFLLSVACSSSGADDTPTPEAGSPPGADASSSADRDAEGTDGGSSPQDGRAPERGGAVSAHGALRVQGSRIVDAAGQPVQLRGMSLFWSQWAPTFYTADTVRSLAREHGSTVVRAAMAVEQGGYLENPEAELARVRTVIDAAIAEDVYVIVDWHDHHADQHLSQAVQFFQTIANEYPNTPNLLFEIWNEPLQVAWSTVKTYATSVISALRTAGAENVVLVGSPNWSSDPEVAADDPVADANVAYTLHFYAASHKDGYRNDAQAALDKGVAVFASEWGTCEAHGSGHVDTEESQRWLDFMAERHIGWANWSLFDKDETCAALIPGTTPTGPWSTDVQTPSGRFVLSKIAER